MPKRDYQLELGRAVQTLRTSRGLKQEDLAKAADVSIGQISNIERGEFWPSLPTLIAIAQVLDVRVADVFGFELASGDQQRAAEQARLLAMTSSLSPNEIAWAAGLLKAALERPATGPQSHRRPKGRR